MTRKNEAYRFWPVYNLTAGQKGILYDASRWPKQGLDALGSDQFKDRDSLVRRGLVRVGPRSGKTYITHQGKEEIRRRGL